MSVQKKCCYPSLVILPFARGLIRGIWEALDWWSVLDVMDGRCRILWVVVVGRLRQLERAVCGLPRAAVTASVANYLHRHAIPPCPAPLTHPPNHAPAQPARGAEWVMRGYFRGANLYFLQIHCWFPQFNRTISSRTQLHYPQLSTNKKLFFWA